MVASTVAGSARGSRGTRISGAARPGPGTTEADRGEAARRLTSDALSNMPLQRTKACQLSVDDCRAGAARLFKWSERRRAAPAVLLSTITYRPSPLNGKAFDRPRTQWLVIPTSCTFLAWPSCSPGLA